MRSGSGYLYTYNDEGKVVSLARHTMEQHLGQQLSPHVTVGYKNGDRTDCRLENLYLRLKNGTPIEHLICKECGSRGSFKIESQE